MTSDSVESQLRRNRICFFLLGPLAWFAFVVFVSNSGQIELMGLSFINMDKWMQGRVAMHFLGTTVWAIACGLLLVLMDLPRFPDWIVAALVIWNLAIIGTAAYCICWQVPSL